MTIDERLHIIGEFIRRSDEEFDDGGNNLIAAELLWGAVAHGLIAIAEINGWRCEGHRGYQAVSVQLDEHSSPGPWRSDTAAAEQLHVHFYQGHLGQGELRSRRTAAKRAINRLFPMIR